MPIVLICLMLVYAGLAVFVWHHQKKNARHYPLKTELAILAPALLVHGLVLILPVLHDHVPAPYTHLMMPMLSFE